MAVKLAVIIVVLLSIAIFAYEFGVDKYEDYASRDARAQAQRIREANKNESITINYATELLNSCKLRNVFIKTNDNKFTINTEVDNSAEGVVLVKLNGIPYVIWVNNQVNRVLKPALDAAKKSCPNFGTS